MEERPDEGGGAGQGGWGAEFQHKTFLMLIMMLNYSCSLFLIINIINIIVVVVIIIVINNNPAVQEGLK